MLGVVVAPEQSPWEAELCSLQGLCQCPLQTWVVSDASELSLSSGQGEGMPSSDTVGWNPRAGAFVSSEKQLPSNFAFGAVAGHARW